MNEQPLNRLKFSQALDGGFANKEATGKLPDPLPQPLLLNLGCGLDIREGFINIDLYSDDPRVVFMDIRMLELPDDSADVILASDILEHFSHRQTDAVLKEWARVLKPNAEMIIRCPSLSLQVKAYTEGKWDADIASYMIFGGQTNPGDYHCIAFDRKSIEKHLKNAGLEITHFEEQDLPQDKGYINLNMIVKATKPVDEKENDFADIEEQISSGLDFTSEDKTETELSTVDDLSAFDFTNDDEEDEKQQENLIVKPKTYDLPEEPPFINLVWEGSQFVYHSLALINREHCLNLYETEQVNLTVIPYEKDQFDHRIDERLEIINNADIRNKPDQTDDLSKLPYCWVRHQWPPKETPPSGAKWIIMQPWEFSQLREDFAEVFKQADEIWTPSNFTRRAYIDSGLDPEKVQVVPNGVNPQLFKPSGDKYELNTNKKLKFLFVGGTIFRKGIDILLHSYVSAFTSRDDVTLIIKDMGGDSFYKGQTAKEKIKEIQKDKKAPEIIYIEDYLTEVEMTGLYRACDVFVCSYRGEGFSLPTLEAMACGLPVVVTEGGATDDFVTEDYGWFIPAAKRSIGDTIDGRKLTGEAFILEPDQNALVDILRIIFENPSNIINSGILAQLDARTKWTWKRSTLKLLQRLDFLYGSSMAKKSDKILTDNHDAYITLGMAEAEYVKENYQKADSLFEEAANSGELTEIHLGFAYNRRAYIAFNNNDYKNAINLSDKSLSFSQENPDARIIRTLAFNKQNKIAEALEEITIVMNNWNENKYNSTLSKSLDDVLCITGNILVEIEDLEGANQIFTEALKYNPENQEACYGAARCFEKAEATEQAITMYEWALKIDPEYKKAKDAISRLKQTTT